MQVNAGAIHFKQVARTVCSLLPWLDNLIDETNPLSERPPPGYWGPEGGVWL
jgi:hypothetical protein